MVALAGAAAVVAERPRRLSGVATGASALFDSNVSFFGVERGDAAAEVGAGGAGSMAACELPKMLVKAVFIDSPSVVVDDLVAPPDT